MSFIQAVTVSSSKTQLPRVLCSRGKLQLPSISAFHTLSWKSVPLLPHSLTSFHLLFRVLPDTAIFTASSLALYDWNMAIQRATLSSIHFSQFFAIWCPFFNLWTFLIWEILRNILNVGFCCKFYYVIYVIAITFFITFTRKRTVSKHHNAMSALLFRDSGELKNGIGIDS